MSIFYIFYVAFCLNMEQSDGTLLKLNRESCLILLVFCEFAEHAG